MSSITELFAYLTTANDVEEIATYQIHDGGADVQLVATDRQHAEGMHPMARTIAEESKTPLRLVRFTEVEELAIVEPVAS